MVSFCFALRLCGTMYQVSMRWIFSLIQTQRYNDYALLGAPFIGYQNVAKKRNPIALMKPKRWLRNVHPLIGWCRTFLIRTFHGNYNRCADRYSLCHISSSIHLIHSRLVLSCQWHAFAWTLCEYLKVSALKIRPNGTPIKFNITNGLVLDFFFSSLVPPSISIFRQL